MLVSQDLGVDTTHSELLSSPLSKAPRWQQCPQGPSLASTSTRPVLMPVDHSSGGHLESQQPQFSGPLGRSLISASPFGGHAPAM